MKLKSFDCYELNVHTFIPDHAVGIVIMSHGFLQRGHSFSFLKNSLNSKGLGLVVYDVRGHGDSTMPFGDVNAYTDYIKDCKKIMDWCNENYPNTPLALMGFSLGGMISTLTTQTYPDEVSALVSISSGLYPHAFARVTTEAMTVSTMFHTMMQIPESDTEILFKPVTDASGFDTVSASFIRNVLYEGPKQAREHASLIQCPTLFIHGTDDLIVPFEATRIFYNEISSPDKTIWKINKGEHDILNRKTEPDSVEALTGWILSKVK